ncbi:tyrosine-type recombinase/integrase [Cryobacterium sp. PH31-O1]|uniref:tyrosine-type recombinase/integrase n=1 Tax=Cryobacterium sp. PH31-O1 TaxID=3046306 RepID=UPI0024BB7A14|nr:tyrosine-type recombinase/integrase [Cryobacterium sp. PH31-O1]MDJ0338366.1 tyrosine-type recombinase/integrase [Cryobacterium sp. PH31-O1]
MLRPGPIEPMFNAQMTAEEMAATAFLARYKGATRVLYLGDLRIFFEWCAVNGIRPLGAERVHIEFFARYLEEVRGNGAAATFRRLSVIKGFYRIAEADGRISHSPMTFVRMPKVVWDENAAMGLDRSQLRQLIQTARTKSTTDAALVILMGMLGLRVSEACSVQIEDFAETKSGHRVLRVMGKGGKPATIPLPPPVLQALENCAGDRTVGQLLVTNIGTAMERGSAYRRIKSLGKLAGLPAGLHPHTLRHSAITAALDGGATLRDAQIFARHADPRMTVRYDRNRGNLDRHAAHGLAAYLDDEA